MIAITRRPGAPRHLVLGAMGYDAVRDRLQRRLARIRAQHAVGLSADFPRLRKQQSKAFFFEKKKQKTFVPSLLRRIGVV